MRHGGANFTPTIEFQPLAGVMTHAAQIEQQRTACLLVELRNKTGFSLLAALTDRRNE